MIRLIVLLMRLKPRWTWREYAILDEEMARLSELYERWDAEDAAGTGGSQL